MANELNRFAALMERVAQGDQHAAVELFDQYHKAMDFVIRHRLRTYPQLRSLFDPSDFLQEVWQDVFAHPEKLCEFATFQTFLKYLVEAARHKVDKAKRKYATQKRDRRRVRHLGAPGVAAVAESVAGSGHGPAERIAIEEEWVSWMLSLPQGLRQVVFKLRDGFSHQEIAAEFNCSVRSIERTVAKLRSTPTPVPLPYL